MLHFSTLTREERCSGGEIGRRASLRCWWEQSLGGSSPLLSIRYRPHSVCKVGAASFLVPRCESPPIPLITLTPILEPCSLDATLRVNETFHSIQGESTFVGCPCFFIRLGGCPLRCHYCDTEYAFRESAPRTLGALLDEARRVACPLVELTGGEPLAQARAFALIRMLCDAAFTVLIETSGSIDIQPTDPRAILVMDLKTPGSGECEKNLLSNLAHLRPHDEVKFVLTSREDYLWAREMIKTHALIDRVRAVLMSPVAAQARGKEIEGCAPLDPRALAEWILADRLQVRQQTQLHKHIWEPQTRGV